MVRRWCLSLAICCLAVGVTGAPARAQVALKWKFPDGLAMTITETLKTKQTLTLAGMPIETSAEQTEVVQFKAGDRAADGTLKATRKVTGLKSKIGLPGGVEIDFDSAKENAPLGSQFDFMIEVLNASAKAETTVVYDGQNKVVRIDGADKVAEKLDGPAKEAIKDQIDSEYMATVANAEMRVIPSRPLNVGDTWEESVVVRFGSGQTMKFTTNYKYEGPTQQGERTLDKISLELKDVEFAIDNPVLKLKEEKLAVAASSGTILFDRERGQLVASQDKHQIKGTLTFIAGDNELPGNLDLTIETTGKVEIK